MSLYMAILLALGIVMMLRKARYNFERLPRIPYVAGAHLPEVAVIVPAVGEVDTAPLLGGFPEEFLVVVGQASQADDEVRFVSAPEAPDSYCAAGAAAAGEAEWLLFVDPGCRVARVLLPSLIDYAAQEGLEMVSVIFDHRPSRLIERILQPYQLALLFAGVSASRLNGRPPGQFLTAGSCLLVHRKAYAAMGGHGPACGSALEDAALWKAAADKGIRTRVVRAEQFGTSLKLPQHLHSDLNLKLRATLSAILLLLWLPMLAWLATDGLYRQAAIFAVIPSLILLPWYRGPVATLAPAAIYLSLPETLRKYWGGEK